MFLHDGEYLFAFSSNIGMAQVGERLGPERMYAGLSLFGFGRKPGIELPVLPSSALPE